MEFCTDGESRDCKEERGGNLSFHFKGHLLYSLGKNDREESITGAKKLSLLPSACHKCVCLQIPFWSLSDGREQHAAVLGDEASIAAPLSSITQQYGNQAGRAERESDKAPESSA